MKWTARTDRIARIAILVLVGLAFTFEIIRDVKRPGDFVGYVNAGNAVLSGTHIYADYLNTWPPFFAIFSVPLALLDQISPMLARFLWLLGIIVSWFFIVKKSNQLFGDSNYQGIPIWKKLVDWKVLIPFLFVLRFVIDDISNIQINSFLLLACLSVIQLDRKGKYKTSGLLLGLAVSLKVYPIFLMLYMIVNRSWRSVMYATLTIGLAFLTTLLIFGSETGISYYTDWLQNKAMGDTIITHKNQALLPWVTGLLCDVTRGLEVQYNVVAVSLRQAKLVTYGLIALSAALVYYRLQRVKLSKGKLPISVFAFVLATMPLLSPLAWKYYFVFLFPLHVTLFTVLRKQIFTSALGMAYLIVSLLLIVSTDGVIGNYWSDVLEVFGVITLSTVGLLLIYLKVYPSHFGKKIPK